MTGLAGNFSICMDPERNGAADRDAFSFIREEALEAEMVSVVGSRKDPEEIHTVQVAGAEKPKDTVIVYSIGTEFEATSLIAGVHDDGKQSAGAECFPPITGNLHTLHGACQDHVDRLGDIDQLAHADAVEDSLER